MGEGTDRLSGYPCDRRKRGGGDPVSRNNFLVGDGLFLSFKAQRRNYMRDRKGEKRMAAQAFRRGLFDPYDPFYRAYGRSRYRSQSSDPCVAVLAFLDHCIYGAHGIRIFHCMGLEYLCLSVSDHACADGGGKRNHGFKLAWRRNAVPTISCVFQPRKTVWGTIRCDRVPAVFILVDDLFYGRDDL